MLNTLVTTILTAIFTLGFVPGSSAAERAAKVNKRAKVAKRDARQVEISLSQIRKASKRVDELVGADLAKRKARPNPLTNDAAFARRVYLDVVGRIPSYHELRTFLESKDADKRSRLIDELLQSEGYVSHYFNYFADLLRIQSRTRYSPSKPYIDFVKDSLRENKPYDQFVRELITAEGYTWDNGAAGYYLRDTGMPLDNMSNTAQVFLGTQLVCAQCHDHPYDSWTQKQYYQMAAFTYGVDTRDRQLPMYVELRKMRRKRTVDRNVVQAANRILQPLVFRVNETDRQLRLPHDYQYDDAKPKSPIAPGTIFGQPAPVEPGQRRSEVYARWMTSPDNERFVTVIANRLWKRLMGVGLIEPVDDFKDGIDPSNPELMSFLSQQMVDLKFDLRQYLRVLLNSEVYQRQVSTVEPAADKQFVFTGPALRRMTAEQIWDSMMTLIITEVDQRKGMDRYQRYADAKDLVDIEMKDLLKQAKTTAKNREMQQKIRDATLDLQKKLRVATRTGDRAETNQIRAEMNKIRARILGPGGEMKMRRERSRASSRFRETDPRWRGFSRDLVRASEVESPARPGHFLRQFGQSDRETIENANMEASVPQILTLLNGPIHGQLVSRNSVFAKNVMAVKDAERQLDVIFLSILGHRPSDRDREILLPHLGVTNVRNSRDNRAIADVAWAVLNTRRFLFIQ